MKPPTREEVQAANVRLHSLLADVYRDTEPHFRPENVARVESILAELQARTGGTRLLDVGCGTGFVIDIAKRHFPFVRGIDITPAMLAKVDCSGGDVQVAEARSEQIPFEDGSFDVCTAYAVLHHLHELGPSLREVFRVLRPGGLFYADLDPNQYFWMAVRGLPEGRYAPVIEREINAIRHKDRELLEKYGVDTETLNRAEQFKHGEGGFREELLREEFVASGFCEADIGYNWFLGEGSVIHSPALRQAAAAMRSHLQELLPLSRHLFKYVHVVARKEQGRPAEVLRGSEDFRRPGAVAPSAPDGEVTPGVRRVVDLRAAPLLLPAYVRLRNRWRGMLLTEAVTEEGTRVWLETADVEVCCLEEDGRFIGAAVLYRARDGEIAVFTAEPGRRGAGTTLLAHVEAVARRQGLRAIVARVRSDNPAGLAAFRKASFEEAGRRSEPYGGALVECVMFRKQLAPTAGGSASAGLVP